MLAAKGPPLEELVGYPYLVQEKVDGIRCLISGGRAFSRSGKLLPNIHLQEIVRDWPDGLDGELVFRRNFSATSSLIMSRDALIPRKMDMSHGGIKQLLGPLYTGLEYVVFDDWSRGGRPYKSSTFEIIDSPFIWMRYVKSVKCEMYDDIIATVERPAFRRLSPEGFIVRGKVEEAGPYKHGRSTVKQEYLLKYKNLEDSEAKIIACVPLERNLNEPELDAFGYQKRSSKKEGKQEESSLLGALTCELPNGTQFNVGTGFTESQRRDYWIIREHLPGKWISFTHLTTGAQEAPRHPVFKGFRDLIDL